MDEEENDYVEAHGFDDDDGEAEEDEEDGNEGCTTYFFIFLLVLTICFPLRGLSVMSKVLMGGEEVQDKDCPLLENQRSYYFRFFYLFVTNSASSFLTSVLPSKPAKTSEAAVCAILSNRLAWLARMKDFASSDTDNRSRKALSTCKSLSVSYFAKKKKD